MVAVAAGCSTDARPRERPADGSRIRITVDADGAGPGAPRTAALRCAPEDRRRVCVRLRRLPRAAFLPVPADAVCSALYGGPARAAIRGVVDGARVDASYSRRDGCEIARYERVEPLLDVARRR